MVYRCTSNNLHIWGWTDFKEAINGKVVSYDANGGVINSIDYKVDGIIDKKVCKEYGINYKKIN